MIARLDHGLPEGCAAFEGLEFGPAARDDDGAGFAVIVGPAAKARIATEVEANAWPLLESGRVAPVIDSEFALADAAKAHARMESSAHIGKIVLKVA